MATARGKRRFTERTRPLLTNPHKGCATFQRFNGDPLNAGERWSEEGPVSFPPPVAADVMPGYLPSTVSYCRWFWDVLEPEPGQLDFSMVDEALRTARRRGQTLQVRLMPHGSAGQPQLPRWYRDRHPTRLGGKKAGGQYVEPRYDGPEYLEAWGRVIWEFGRRFDGHPDLESVDMAFIGPWGEGAGEISDTQIRRFIDLYFHAHPRTPLLANIDGYQFPYGISRGAGWRCDCFGDTGIWGEEWNHTYDYYPKAVFQAGAGDRWRTMPVTLETCGVPQTWQDKGFDLDFILAQGYKTHASVFMPKSSPLPGEYMDPLAAFCDRLGYRFVLRQAIWNVESGDTPRLALDLWIENTGVAPLYRPYVLALRIRSARRERWVGIPGDVRTWLPGDVWVEERLSLPGGWGDDPVELALGLVEPAAVAGFAAEDPAPDASDPVVSRVRFAVEETDPLGWVPLGKVEL